MAVLAKTKRNSFKTVLKLFCFSFVSVSFHLCGQFKPITKTITVSRQKIKEFQKKINFVPNSRELPGREAYDCGDVFRR